MPYEKISDMDPVDLPLSGNELLEIVQGGRNKKVESSALIGAAGPEGDPGAPGADGLDGSDGAAGADGADGRTVLSGPGTPSSGLGADGDFYIDTTVWDIYGPKTAGAWGAGTSLVGPAGSGSGSGDMLKSVYDPDDDGKVSAAENADTLAGTTPTAAGLTLLAGANAAAQLAVLGGRSLVRWIEFDTPEFVKYVSSTSIKIAGSGRAVVNGTLLEWESDITWSGSSGSAPLAAAGMVYGYLYDSGGGTAALEVSTTAPEFNATHKYWRKTGDSSRRCVWAGYVWATTTPTYRIVPFIAMWQSGSAEIIYESEYIDASNRFSLGGSLNVVSAGTATTPTSITLSHVAQHASHWYVSSKLTFVSANDDAIGIINHSSWTTTGAAADAPLFSVRNTAVVAGSRTYFGRAWLPVRTARTAYYCLQHMVGTTANIYLEDPGFRIPV